jgi:hypothetical protein
MSNSVIHLNVGGHLFSTTLSTLNQRIGNESENVFTQIFQNQFVIEKDQEGRIFFDRDGKYFSYILNYLRQKGNVKEINFPFGNHQFISQLILESKFFGLHHLTDYLIFKDKKEINMKFERFSPLRGKNAVLHQNGKSFSSVKSGWSTVSLYPPLDFNMINFIEFDLTISNTTKCHFGIQKRNLIQFNRNSLPNSLFSVSQLQNRRNRIGIMVDFEMKVRISRIFNQKLISFYLNGDDFFQMKIENEKFKEEYYFCISFDSNEIEVSILNK